MLIIWLIHELNHWLINLLNLNEYVHFHREG